MTNHLRDILVLSAISVLLMIGTYKCGRESVESEVITDVSTPKIEAKFEETIEVEETVDEEYIEEETSEEYFLIVGSFNDEQIAQEYVDQLSGESNDAFIIEQDGYYRVSIFSSKNYDLLVQKKEELSYTGQKMWIHSQYTN